MSLLFLLMLRVVATRSQSSIIETSFVITPSTVSSAPNISITTGSSTTVVNNSWNIAVQSQIGTDLSLDFDSSWAFHATAPSTLRLTLSGRTPSATYDNDGEMMFVFGIDDV